MIVNIELFLRNWTTGIMHVFNHLLLNKDLIDGILLNFTFSQISLNFNLFFMSMAHT